MRKCDGTVDGPHRGDGRATGVDAPGTRGSVFSASSAVVQFILEMMVQNVPQWPPIRVTL